MHGSRTQLSTLEAYLTSHGPAKLDQALEMCLRILTVLDYCHDKNMTHNHLTPDKIVISEGLPVLIDFSFPIKNGHGTNGNSDSAKEPFIELPEHQLSLDIVERCNKITDVTAVAGLLFYALTGLAPGPLKDKDGRMPHQRPTARMKLNEVSANKLFMVNHVFDKAFRWQANDRYHSASEFKEDLEKMLSHNPLDTPLASLDEIVNGLRTNTQSQTVTPHEMRLQTAFAGLQVIFAELAHTLEPDFREMEAGYRKEILRPVYTAFIKFNYRLIPDARLVMTFRMEIVGSEIVVTGQVISNGQETVKELFRTEHHSFYDSSALEKSVRNFVAFNIACVLGSSAL